MAGRAANEIEIKLRIDDVAALKRKLNALGARLLHRVHESNTVFDIARHRLRKTGQLLRLRIESGAGFRDGSPRSTSRAVLTYKHPVRRHPGTRYKIRKEVELSVGDPAALGQIFMSLGLQPSFRYEKYRTTYGLPNLQPVLVELDETPIGVFLELEGAPRSIDRASRLLGFTPDDYLVSSYATLYFQFCRRHRIPATDMLFARVKSAKKSR
ncbi:MAG: class IV adenylate cyclase [Acidipila sp.]|nr:class IV adenylate cyclase [Acidipila sp.]